MEEKRLLYKVKTFTSLAWQLPLPFATPSVKKRNGKIRVCAAMKAPVGLLSGRAVCAADGGTLSRQAPQIFPFRK